MRRLFTAMRQQIEACPSVFMLLPSQDFQLLETWLELATQEEELELALYCEHDSGWNETQHNVYRFSLDRA